MAADFTDPLKKKEDPFVDPANSVASASPSDPLDFSQFKETSTEGTLDEPSAGTVGDQPGPVTAGGQTNLSNDGKANPTASSQTGSAVDAAKVAAAGTASNIRVQVEPTGTADEKAAKEELAKAERAYDMSPSGMEAKRQAERELARERRSEQRAIEKEKRDEMRALAAEERSEWRRDRQNELNAVEAKIKAYNARISSTGWSSSILGSGSGLTNLFRGLDMTVKGKPSTIGGLYAYQQELLNMKANYTPIDYTPIDYGDKLKVPETKPESSSMVIGRNEDGTAKIYGSGKVSVSDIKAFANRAGYGTGYVFNRKTKEIYQKKKDEGWK